MSNRHDFRTQGRVGFSLLELMVAISLVAVVLLLGASAYQSLRERGADSRCMTNLRLLGAATLQYAAEHRGELPYYFAKTNTGATGSGSIEGAWFYHLAPYVGVPRREGLDPARATWDRRRLGTSESSIQAPCVFTCPSHRRDESNADWKPQPMSFPTDIPVSYAPSLQIRQEERFVLYPNGTRVYPMRLAEIAYPSSKVWLMDSPKPLHLNTSTSRWAPKEEYQDNWARQGFSRHHGGGHVLYFDGHLEWLPLETFTRPANQSLTKTTRLYFNPWRDPALDR